MNRSAGTGASPRRTKRGSPGAIATIRWLAFDRAIKSAEAFGLEGSLDRWRALRRLVGNFPQAFSHVALVDSAYLFLSRPGQLQQATQPKQPAVDGRVVPTTRRT
ncbi:MAG: hypothetical protein ACXWVL_01335 [Rhodoplanes sp.]